MGLKFHIYDSLMLITLMFFLPSKLSAQNWFPLEVGNRWDYSYYGLIHGGGSVSDSFSVEVIGDTIMSMKNYFILSRPFDGLLEDVYLRVENDTLFCFNTEDSADCFMYAFNQTLGVKYYSCKYDTVHYFDELFDAYFGFPDTQQAQSPYYNSDHLYYFSKKFGLVYIDYSHPLFEYWTTLEGCIISGVTYGQLLTTVKDKKNNFPSSKLEQNYPNPFNSITNIDFEIPNRQMVRLKVYDILGNQIAELVNGEVDAGKHRIKFNSDNLSSSIYIYQLQTNSNILSRKMILLK